MQLFIPKVIRLLISTKNGLKSSVIFAPDMYKVLRSILFWFPPEWVHYFSMNCLRLLCSIGGKPLLKAMFSAQRSTLNVLFCGLEFKNPVGLGAGFDKNAKYLRELECLGFGFVEIGTVTPIAQKGNDKPRLFRLPTDKALINRMGFNNDGVKVIAERLKQWSAKNPRVKNNDSRLQTPDSRLIIGGNIGKNKSTPNEEAWKDYEICFKELHPYVDYFVVNVSSPNTPGLRELQEKESLRKILLHLQMINNGKAIAKPILLKIAPDLSKDQVDDVIDLAMEIKLDGLVATNTTISRDGLSRESGVKSQESIGLRQGRIADGGGSQESGVIALRGTKQAAKQVGSREMETRRETGGLSGMPLRQKSTDMVIYISEKTKGQLPIIASGGIFTGDDTKEKLWAGASLVQVWTGFIYEGPGIVKNICKKLG
jgi:dihydroorotate dehydrogenase